LHGAKITTEFAVYGQCCELNTMVFNVLLQFLLPGTPLVLDFLNSRTLNDQYTVSFRQQAYFIRNTPRLLRLFGIKSEMGGLQDTAPSIM